MLLDKNLLVCICPIQLTLHAASTRENYVKVRLLPCSCYYEPSSRGGHSHTLPIRVCAAQRGRDFEAPGLERGIHFRGDF